jgi:hypothetical protein
LDLGLRLRFGLRLGSRPLSGLRLRGLMRLEIDLSTLRPVPAHQIRHFLPGGGVL